MQGVAGLVLMPHKTNDGRCSVGPATSTDVGAGEKTPSSPSKPTTEGNRGYLLLERVFIH